MKQQIRTALSFWWSVFKTLYISQWRTVTPKRKQVKWTLWLTQLSAWRVSRLWHMEGKATWSLVFTFIKESELGDQGDWGSWSLEGDSYTKTPEIGRDQHTRGENYLKPVKGPPEILEWSSNLIQKWCLLQPATVKNLHGSWGEYSEVLPQ